MNKNQVIEQIKEELIELNFNVNSVGIAYWIEAIKYAKENPLVWNMTDIYENVAKKYNTTTSKVERGMRTAISPAKKNIEKKYKYYNKINNGTYIGLIRYKLI